MPSLIQPLLRTMTPACHPPHLTPALFKSHSQQLPSSRCIESAHPLPCDPRFLAEGASDTALGLLDNCRSQTLVRIAIQLAHWPMSHTLNRIEEKNAVMHRRSARTGTLASPT